MYLLLYGQGTFYNSHILVQELFLSNMRLFLSKPISSISSSLISSFSTGASTVVPDASDCARKPVNFNVLF